MVQSTLLCVICFVLVQVLLPYGLVMVPLLFRLTYKRIYWAYLVQRWVFWSQTWRPCFLPLVAFVALPHLFWYRILWWPQVPG